jgi:hypothetical protein
MTRWRVDFRVKSDVVLAKHEKKLLFTPPDNSYEIYLFTNRGQGKHEADELYLSAHVVLEDEDRQNAADKAEVHLRQFLNVLTIVTNAYYRIEARILVADWTPGLEKRRLLYFKGFPNPHVPIYALSQKEIETVKKLMRKPIPRSVQLAMGWWARGVSAEYPNGQFQFFWYALEILAEHAKPSVKVPSKCPTCNGDLYCPICKQTPLHRPYPKQAVKMLVDKHVRGEPDRFFQLIDEARNRLLHGDDPTEIERELDIKWEKISDSLGKATWAALVDTLIKNITATGATEAGKLVLMEANTYVHYHVTIGADMEMGAAHADPANPQIEEFQPDFQLNMIVQEGPKETKTEPAQPALEGEKS